MRVRSEIDGCGMIKIKFGFRVSNTRTCLCIDGKDSVADAGMLGWWDEAAGQSH